jgi:hypothetical protein
VLRCLNLLMFGVFSRVVKANIVIADIICQDHDEVRFLASLERWDGPETLASLLIRLLLQLLQLLNMGLCSCIQAACA